MAAKLSSITDANTDPIATAVFLDRDGVINENRPDYVKNVSEFIFLPNSLTAIRNLSATGLKIIIITNQSAVGRGLISALALEEIHAYMLKEITMAGGRIDKIISCMHHPNEHCACRKPKSGMLFEAAEQFGLDLSHTYLVGDAQSDVEAALRVGSKAIQVATGRGSEERKSMPPYLTLNSMYVEDILAAADMIQTNACAH